MADLETGLNIPVSAYADKDSAKEAVDNLTKSVLSSLKNGYIEVPAEVKTSFNRGSKELDIAQKDVINQWEKMSKEGFSSSEEYLDDLINKYKKFKSLAGKEGKGNSKQAKWLTKTIGGSLQPYLTQRRELENIISGFEKVGKGAGKTSIKQHRINTNKKYKGIEKVLPKGFKTDSGVDAGRTTDYELRRSEVSSYPSNFARQMAKSANEAKKWEDASLKQEINKEKANRLAADARARGGNKKRLTPAEKAKGLSTDLLGLLPELINKISTSEDDSEIAELSEKFFATSKAIFTYNKEAGEEVYSIAKKEIGAALAPFYSVKGNIGLTDGTDKSEASRDDRIENLLKGLLDKIEAKEEEIKQELIKLAQLDEKKTKSKSSKSNSFADRAISGENIIGSDAEIVQENKTVRKRNNKKIPKSAKEAISSSMGNCPCQTILEAIASNVQLIANSIKSGKLTVIDATNRDKKSEKTIQTEVAKTQEKIIKSSMVSLSKDVASSIKKAFGIKNTGPNASTIMGMSQADQEKLRAQRISTFGLSDSDRNATATGTRGNVFYRKSAYGWGRNNQNPFENLRLTQGMGIDSKGITDALQTALQKNMFNAQTGGVMKNLIGSMTGYIGMPSLEKSRAEAEGLNQIMANIRQVALELLQAIQSKETDLRGLERSGQVSFNDQGALVEDLTSNKEGTKLFGDMEEQKQALQGVLAELAMVDQLVDSTGGNITKIVQQLGFVAPELRSNNAIIQNLNAGLDKNGKALKFQTRTAEVLNYSFQLMARHIGRMIKNWIVMMNPINMIKRAFQDFASYDVKWQRTMNVIKYNLRRIVKPFMEWLAQQLVNIIGLVNALIKGIGKAFGQNWDLFDKSAASAEQMREELEAAANVTAGFDELHDIGGESSSNPAMDLTGDIYTPQWEGLYKVIENFGEKIGSIFATIKKITEGWDFWDWLILAGAALVGFLVLKTLINWFTGKNPLQSVADGFSFLEKAVGWAILIWAFTEFTKALTKFVECMKSASWEDIAKSLIMLAGAFAALTVAAGGLMYIGTALGIATPALLGLSAVVGAFALFTIAMTNFIKVVKECTAGEIIQSLAALAGALSIVGITILALLVALSAIISTGVGALAIVALAAVLTSVAIVIVAMAKFVKELGNAGEGIKKICEGVAEVIKVLFTGIVEVVTVVGGVITTIIGSIGGAISEIVYSVGSVVSTVITTVCDGVQGTILALAQAIATVLTAVADIITRTFETVGEVIIGIIDAIASAIETVLTPIMEFIDSVMGKILDLAETVSHEIGETIRSVIQTTGDVIVAIIRELINLIPNLLSSILGFISGIGPAIEQSANAIMRTITSLINFVVSGIEYLVNTLLIDSINSAISSITWGAFPHVFDHIAIARFVPQYEQGTNYVPNDGLAYLHQGEAVVPKKYNQPLESGLTIEEKAYMQQMMTTMRSLDSTMKQGISVNGQFVQRGSDLVAVVNKTKSQIGADLLSNVSYAR